jgi:hypothetical protein
MLAASSRKHIASAGRLGSGPALGPQDVSCVVGRAKRCGAAEIRTALIAIAAALPLAGCGLLYDIAQDRALDNCDRASSPQDRTACRKANSQSYEDYEARRKRLKQGQPA